MLEETQFKSIFLIMILAIPRILAAFIIIPFFSKQILAGIIVRNGIAISMAVFLYPVMKQIEYKAVVGDILYLIILKEIFIGFVLGILVSLPLWAFTGVGLLIDNQRGSTMANTLNPLTGDQDSTMGIFLNQVIAVFFFASGAFFSLMFFLYNSYVIWPVDSFYPSFSSTGAEFFLQKLDYMMAMLVILAAPVLIAMFLSEFTFALMNRFAQQLNVFILSMPVKSVVALFVLIFYLGILIYFYEEYSVSLSVLMEELQVLFL